jgi:DNA replication licensing factor MCM7
VENINLPAALLSRFDILFLLLDTPTRENDAQLAKHVAYVHMNSRHPDLAAGGGDGVVFTPHEMRSYVAEARTYRPTVPESVSDYLIKTYVRMRETQRRAEKQGKQFTHTTPRTLLGVVRLAQALARLRFASTVSQDDVDEALRLVEASKASLDSDQGRSSRRGVNASSRIYNLVKVLADTGACRADDAEEDDEFGVELSLRRVRERVLAKGFTEDQWNTALDEYTELDVRSFCPVPYSHFFSVPLTLEPFARFTDTLCDRQVWQTAGNGTRLVFITSNNGEDEEEP